ncbi:MAG TPA: sodium:solute symporter family protein [Halothiobacillaceae bacterium]|nr:sodium:solute symporter family protein [Halothiobacillaceae bacterium]
MLGLELLDWLILLAYLVGVTIIGTWAARRVTSAASYFIGDRKFGKVMMVFFMFGSGTHSDQAVGVASKTYQSGASGIWYQWQWLFATPFYWIAAPVFRRMRAVTTGDYFQARYGPSVSVLYAAVAMMQFTVMIGMMLKGSAAMVEAVTGGAISATVAMIVMTVMFVIYGLAGGMSAAIVTDFIQGVLTIFFSFLLLPFALQAVGGLSGLAATLDPEKLQIVAPREITAFYIAIIAINALIGWATQPHTMAVCAAGKTEMEGRVGVTFGMFGKRICTIAWMLTALCALALYAGTELDPDHIYGTMAAELLPKVGAGLIGLFIACMLASVMSSCDAFMVAAAGLFTENLYKKIAGTDRPDRHYVLIGRLASLTIVVAGIAFALTLESVVDALEIFWMVAAMMGIAFWVGLFWRRATVAGAWAGTLASFAVLLFTSRIAFGPLVLWDFNARFAGYLPDAFVYEGRLLLSWQMVFYLVTGLVVLVLVSLRTRRVNAEKLDRLYACLRTPIGPNEPEIAPFTLPPGVLPAPRRVLWDHPDFEIPRPTVIGMAGFFASWLAVAALIAVVYWIVPQP